MPEKISDIVLNDYEVQLLGNQVSIDGELKVDGTIRNEYQSYGYFLAAGEFSLDGKSSDGADYSTILTDGLTVSQSVDGRKELEIDGDGARWQRAETETVRIDAQAGSISTSESIESGKRVGINHNAALERTTAQLIEEAGGQGEDVLQATLGGRSLSFPIPTNVTGETIDLPSREIDTLVIGREFDRVYVDDLAVGGDIGSLKNRIAQLESRIADLESGQ